MKTPKEETQKITVNLPVSLINKTMSYNDKSLTETVREALELYKRKMLFERLEAARGKVNFGASWQELKEDRE